MEEVHVLATGHVRLRDSLGGGSVVTVADETDTEETTPVVPVAGTSPRRGWKKVDRELFTGGSRLFVCC